jgi:hypothetical protein
LGCKFDPVSHPPDGHRPHRFKQAADRHVAPVPIISGLRKRLYQSDRSAPCASPARDYWQSAHQGKKKENPFCALLAENSATLAVCLQAHDEMIRRTGDLPHTVTCPFGLTETAVPVKLGEKNHRLFANRTSVAAHAGESGHDKGEPGT